MTDTDRKLGPLAKATLRALDLLQALEREGLPEVQDAPEGPDARVMPLGGFDLRAWRARAARRIGERVLTRIRRRIDRLEEALREARTVVERQRRASRVFAVAGFWSRSAADLEEELEEWRHWEKTVEDVLRRGERSAAFWTRSEEALEEHVKDTLRGRSP